MAARAGSGPYGARGSGFVVLGAVAIVVAACSGGPGSLGRASADPAKDKLAQVIARGTLVGYAELDYPPQSIRVEGGIRAASTKCLTNQMTASEVTGFDVETTKLVAKGLGVEPCFVQPTWTRSPPGAGATGSTSSMAPARSTRRGCSTSG